jgi:hypothetical protein
MIAEEVGLEGTQRLRYVLYMNKRWNLLEIGENYAKEWAQRFKSETEFEFSDTVGRQILSLLPK